MRQTDLSRLQNLGPKSIIWLNAIGIYTRDDLERIEPVMAYQMIKDMGYGPSLNFLYALAGALRGEHWLTVPASVIIELKASVEG
jgi:DNA transformation protein